MKSTQNIEERSELVKNIIFRPANIFLKWSNTILLFVILILAFGSNYISYTPKTKFKSYVVYQPCTQKFNSSERNEFRYVNRQPKIIKGDILLSKESKEVVDYIIHLESLLYTKKENAYLYDNVITKKLGSFEDQYLKALQNYKSGDVENLKSELEKWKSKNIIYSNLTGNVAQVNGVSNENNFSFVITSSNEGNYKIKIPSDLIKKIKEIDSELLICTDSEKKTCKNFNFKQSDLSLKTLKKGYISIHTSNASNFKYLNHIIAKNEMVVIEVQLQEISIYEYIKKNIVFFPHKV